MTSVTRPSGIDTYILPFLGCRQWLKPLTHCKHTHQFPSSTLMTGLHNSNEMPTFYHDSCLQNLPDCVSKPVQSWTRVLGARHSWMRRMQTVLLASLEDDFPALNTSMDELYAIESRNSGCCWYYRRRQSAKTGCIVFPMMSVRYFLFDALTWTLLGSVL